ncbi:MAG: amidohydrolase family protein, partial [Gammaproteobacteria bacterium]|nr:amidohydrolase family protein [Gammaproteobacteria bacterium]
MNTLRFEYVLTPTGLRPAQLQVDDNGRITAVEEITAGPWDGWIALPGMVNAHSHCFQRVMCGYAEAAVGEQSFWGWRELMYRIAQTISPHDQYVIARQAFMEMLAAGFTTVAEFHYLHHGTDARQGPEMASAVIEAAEEVGIRLAMLPVFYQRGGFDQPASASQRRFTHDSVEDFLAMTAKLGSSVAGIAPHSVRAVDPALLPELLSGARSLLGEKSVVHIHVAEQQTEIEQCLAATGRTPVQLLYDHCEPDELWSFV